MGSLSLGVYDVDGACKHLSYGSDEVMLGFRGAYEPGDILRICCDELEAHLVMRLDVCLAESRVLLRGGCFEFPIPDSNELCAYGKGWAFADERHWAYVRREDSREAGAWHDLALNAHDRRISLDERPVLFPHASTNVVCENPQFWARNAIDGVIETFSHGSWPHESWGVNGTADAWLRVEFGEMVEAHELRLYLRTDFPHDSWWRQARVELSDGADIALALEKGGHRQTFDLGRRRIEWLRLYGLERASEDGFCALSALQVWGRRPV